MAMTSGVSMNEVAPVGAIGGWPASASFWFKMVPQALEAGDQMTGAGPFTASSQPSDRAVMALPEDFERTSTKTHFPLRVAC